MKRKIFFKIAWLLFAIALVGGCGYVVAGEYGGFIGALLGFILWLWANLP